ncbi:class I SAM-dependent methyltransferase [Microvirga makkahensis]|uniref:Methyltransferase domain-containing protein n=1 Tax=Microvirga makkahensis TaxID=1128670 RepID=A0A7X3MRM5_9HYPH|nr:class I SAM-dependent methyltransferase [Microvirga makkahensis]MXQ11740.1 methyltransferase domain-containing protein [Microvirga makkahensis]
MSQQSAGTHRLDQQTAEAFAARAADIVNSGAIAIMLSIGHRTGLFDTMAKMSPSTSIQIARAAELSERYVREWLAALVTGGIVTYDPARKTYTLPAEHAASLTREGSLGNLALYGQHVALLGVVQERVISCFETGAGTTYDNYPCFHQIMAEDSGLTVVAQLFDTVLPLVPGLAERLAVGIDMLDAGCGQGRAIIAMAERFPNSRFAGYDLCGDAIEDASRAAAAAGLTNVRFARRDLTDWSEEACYDCITTFDAVHDQKDPQDFLRRLHRALRQDGVYLMQDIGGSARLENNIDFPMASFLYAISCAHCTPVSLGQGGAGLGTMWGWETAESMLRQAGFSDIGRHTLPNDPMNVWFVARTSRPDEAADGSSAEEA